MYVIGYCYVANSTNITSSSKSYGYGMIKLKPKYNTLESIGVGDESKSCEFEASVAEIDNEKSPITGTWLYQTYKTNPNYDLNVFAVLVQMIIFNHKKRQ